MATVEAEPYAFEFDPKTTALVMIDFQRDFVYPGGFGEALGNDTSPLLKALPPSKKIRGHGKITIGDVGPMGRILVRGELGHDIVEEVYPIDGEPVVDKHGKGAFYATDLDAILKMKGIKQLVVCGVTTEVCFHTSVREANDR